MPIIMVAYCGLSKVKIDGVWVKILLDDHALDLQYFFFKMTMVANNETIMKKKYHMNLII
jgi:hypothetical protein